MNPPIILAVLLADVEEVLTSLLLSSSRLGAHPINALPDTSRSLCRPKALLILLLSQRSRLLSAKLLSCPVSLLGRKINALLLLESTKTLPITLLKKVRQGGLICKALLLT